MGQRQRSTPASILIDTPSRVDALIAAAVRVSSLTVLPANPGLLALAPLQETVKLVETAGKRHVAVGCVFHRSRRCEGRGRDGCPKKELLAVTDPLVGSLAWYEQVEARSDRHAELFYELIRKPVLISVVNGS